MTSAGDRLNYTNIMMGDQKFLQIVPQSLAYIPTLAPPYIKESFCQINLHAFSLSYGLCVRKTSNTRKVCETIIEK